MCKNSYCSSLPSVAIPNSVTSIGGSAFYNCSRLTSVTIPNSVTSIGDYTFENCSSLASVTIPNSVTSIGSGAFKNCSSLPSVTIPNSVTSIGEYAFYNCANLEEVYVEWQRPLLVGSVRSTSFSKNDKGFILSTLYVPTGRTRIYEASEVWGDFYDIREYDSNMQNEKYDLDGDGSVNVTDISTIANYILNGDE
ncbi:MAG: leucine-rich repeat protein [Prevotellaceae bacterium]|nr:leucine-rich repeat protein [Candidatus Colivivens caballi]